MRDASNAKNPNATRDKIIAGVAVFVIVLLALFLRSYWNIDAAQTDDGFIMPGGSDPYYHFRAISYIQENGWQTLLHDPLLNYPYGATNPNPPLFHWTVAIAGAAITPFFGGDMETATWWAALWSPAVFGALTIVPAYLIGRDVFNRRTGILAGLLLALSTSHITATAFGNAEHDSMYLFFATLAFWAYVRAIQSFRGNQNWVTNWGDSSTIGPGLSRFFSENRSGLLWSVGAGLGVAAVALMWKGFPYLIGIMFVYVALQLLVDHWRNRESMGIWVGTLVAFLVATLIAWPVYANQNVAGFLRPVWFLIGAFIVMGAVMIPTRDLPSLLVIPAFAVAGIVGVLTAFFAFPSVARSLLYSTVYFRQTSLYQTIAEAHPADFNTLVFAIGPFAFFLALAGLVMLLFRARRENLRPMLFMFVWGVVALYMAQSAVRFLFNASTVLAILAAWATVLVFDWVDFRGISRVMRGSGNFWSGMRRGVNGWHVTTAFLVALLLVFPNAFLAVDAATPAGYDQEKAGESDFYRDRFGAFGQSFLPAYWQNGLNWLADQEDFGSDPGNLANRPGFVSWWDYGHWAIVQGQHPSVADNFQNGYRYAANFLLAQNETMAVQLMSARSFGLLEREGVDPAGLIQQVGVPAGEAEAVKEAMKRWEYVPQLSLEQAVELEGLVTEATKSDLRPDGVRIRYFATDIRMLPFDDPRTNFVDQPSIFYAPVILKGDDPDSYVTMQIRGTDGNYYTQDEFEQVSARRVTTDPNFGPAGSRYVYQDAFANSMYYRGFVGTPMDMTQPEVLGDQLNQALLVSQPGFEMKHWRLSYASPQLRMLEYYKGAILEGTVTEEGDPLSNVTVTAYDDAGHILHPELDPSIRDQIAPEDVNVPHDSVQTDAEGRFRVILPFSLTNGTTVVATDAAGVELARWQEDVSREDAENQRVFTAELNVEKGNVEGFAFHDVEGDGQYNESAGDVRVANAEVTIGGVTVTTGEDGSYRVDSVSSGRQTVEVQHPEYEVHPGSAAVSVTPGETTSHPISLQLRAVNATGRVVYDADGDGVASEGDAPAANTTFAFQPAGDGTGRAAQAQTDAEGNYGTALAPGTYNVTASFQDAEGNAYTAAGETVTVQEGQSNVDLGTILLVAPEE